MFPVNEKLLLIKRGTVYINPPSWNHKCRQAHKKVAQNGIERRPGKLCPGGSLRISSEGDDRRTILGLKFSIPGFFCGSPSFANKVRPNLLWLGNWAWDFWGLIFGPGSFLGFEFCPHSIISVT